MAAPRAYGPVLGTDLHASLTAPRHARSFVRHTLAMWGLTDISEDAQLIASELVANAAEHARPPIRLAIRPYLERSGERGVLCQISDASPMPVGARPLPASGERGRGLEIVSALATRNGVTFSPRGKTAWFTLAAPPGREAGAGVAREIDFEAEAGA
jgi:anti-sigma regulatory factor (Ser/Thr protein kinase)